MGPNIPGKRKKPSVAGRLADCVLAALTLACLSGFAHSQAAPFKDASPHAMRIVDVGAGVKLEVLDWGGRGRPIVLLAGLPHTAHVFDDFAPRLARACSCHVYGVTRRGFGNS